MARSTRSFLWLLLALAGLSAADAGALRAQATLESLPDAASRPALPTEPTEPSAHRIWAEALRAPGRRILISLSDHRLWLMSDDSVRLSAPIAVGKPVVLEYDDRVWSFATPRGRRTVIGKEENPVWTPPDWHYVELALAQGWKLEEVRRGRPVPLSDGSEVAVRGSRIGRVLKDGSFVPVPVGEEAVFEDTLFMPPTDTENRRIPGELGRYKLDLGDAYYIHGTPDLESIGGANTHGCIRMLPDDLVRLYRAVRVGTAVYLY